MKHLLALSLLFTIVNVASANVRHYNPLPRYDGPLILKGQKRKLSQLKQTKLNASWLRQPYDTHEKEYFSGDELKTIGMPIGGIAAGELYLRGDGTLAQWWIANNAYNTGPGGNSFLETPYGLRPVNFSTFTPVSLVDQGFKISIKTRDKVIWKELNKKGFNNIRFTGNYPIAKITYTDSANKLPVDISMEAFTPYIPLNARASATPGTYLIFNLRNSSNAPVNVNLAGWLQNPVCMDIKNDVAGNSRNQIVSGQNMQSLFMDMVPAVNVEAKETVFDDFEDGTYKGWQIKGNAFDKKPDAGQRSNQQPVSGFSNTYYVNSFTDGDKPIGKLISKEFIISNNYINMLVGGGNHPNETAIQLIIDNQVVKSATGKNSEKLELISWDVKSLTGKKARFEIIDNYSGGWGHILVDRITFSDAPPAKIKLVQQHPYFGNVSLSVLDGKASVITDVRTKSTTTTLAPLGNKLIGQVSSSVTLAPYQQKQIIFLLTWYFPNRPLNYGNGFNWGQPIPPTQPPVGNMYANWFNSSAAVANWLNADKQELITTTRQFVNSFYTSSNLPYWLKQRIMMPMSTLATETAQWWANNKFYAWEGVGSCEGTCTHVWNYEQGMAHLFPSLERNLRERTDLSTSLTAEGGVLARNGHGDIRIDGHIGTVLKIYREYLNTENDLFLARNWAATKNVLRYAIQQDAADGHIDGMIENKQPNTYDIDFDGANTFIGSLYLAALKAGEKMAEAMQDKVFADSCKNIFTAGGNNTAKRLWNGEYFFQDVDLNAHPNAQYADGCLSDQLFGQTWAHLLNLGYIYPQDKVKQALQSIWKYNWHADVGPLYKKLRPERYFALDGDAGLFNCSWPLKAYPNKSPVRYSNEVWTGVEYQVATNMIYEGMVSEGLSMLRGISNRYNPTRHNPWNEIECGEHYARAMASWGVLIALENYFYDGPEGELYFAPKIEPANFNGFFTTAKGWGNLLQARSKNGQINTIKLAYGSLQLSRLKFDVDTVRPANVILKKNNQLVNMRWKVNNGQLEISGFQALLNKGDKLTATVL